MKIVVIGSGYVGLVTAACFADIGHRVIGVDIDYQKVDRLKAGNIPIHEPGLSELISQAQRDGRLTFTSSLNDAIVEAEVAFIAVGTPPEEDGSADLSHVLAVAQSLGELMTSTLIVVNKSTVPVGTADKVRAAINLALKNRKLAIDFAVISNPEFLKEGAAINDFQRPDRVVLGGNLPKEDWAMDKMRLLYSPFLRNHDRIMMMDNRSAEMTKYAANAMLATRISFMNDMANLSEKVGADIEQIRRGIGSDSRIGFDFLYAGSGYGGSCFPKDVKAILHTARQHGYPLQLMQAVENVNNQQKHRLVEKIQESLGKNLSNLRVALWGLAFKANTDDIREASALTVIKDLVKSGVTNIHAYDPEAMPNTQEYFTRNTLPSLSLTMSTDPYSALKDADILIVMTEWKVFRAPDWQKVISLMKSPKIFDGRNLYDPQTLRGLGLIYQGIGRITA